MKHIEAQNWNCLRGLGNFLAVGIFALGVFFSGCAVGPDYKPPQTTVAASFATTLTNAIPGNENALATWWKGFNDAALDSLVERAITNNYDVRIATANLKEARALRRLITFDLAPTVQANAAYTKSQVSEDVLLPGTPRGGRDFEIYDAGFDATWELDLFGRVRRSVQAANAQVGSVAATRLDILVSVIAEVARNYFELRGQQNQLAVARKNADVQAQTLKLTESLLQGGRGTDFDVSRSRALLNLTLSSIPPIEAAIQKTIYRIAVLTGRQPAVLLPQLSPPATLPREMPALALGDPATLLRRRPDVRSAERSLAAATARIGVATADLFPRVTFVGSIGLQAETFAGLGQSGTDRWDFGPRITWAAFDLGRVRARIKAADARAEGSLAFYEQTVLSALEETEAALVDFGQEQSRRHFLQTSADASQKAANLAHQRFESGVADFLSVLDAERTLLEAQDRLAASETRTVTALVAIYKALRAGLWIEAK